jgi:hypothetical protein
LALPRRLSGLFPAEQVKRGRHKSIIFDFAHHQQTAGAPLQGMPDFPKHSVAIVAPLVIPETKFLDALTLKEQLPRFVMLALIWQTVLKTIQLDRQPRRRAVEVEPVSGKRVLSPELEPGKPPCSQSIPQFFFLPCLVAPKPPRISRSIHAADTELLCRADKLIFVQGDSGDASSRNVRGATTIIPLCF